MSEEQEERAKFKSHEITILDCTPGNFDHDDGEDAIAECLETILPHSDFAYERRSGFFSYCVWTDAIGSDNGMAVRRPTTRT